MNNAKCATKLLTLRVAREAAKGFVRIEEARRMRSVEYAAAAAGGMNLLCCITARRMLAGEADPFPTALSGIGRKFEVANEASNIHDRPDIGFALLSRRRSS